jgi:hypothetical protein
VWRVAAGASGTMVTTKMVAQCAAVGGMSNIARPAPHVREALPRCRERVGAIHCCSATAAWQLPSAISARPEHHERAATTWELYSSIHGSPGCAPSGTAATRKTTKLRVPSISIAIRVRPRPGRWSSDCWSSDCGAYRSAPPAAFIELAVGERDQDRYTAKPEKVTIGCLGSNSSLHPCNKCPHGAATKYPSASRTAWLARTANDRNRPLCSQALRGGATVRGDGPHK